MAKSEMSILVTGGNGFVGRQLTKVLRLTGANVVSLTRDDADLTNSLQVADILSGDSYDVVVHTASHGPWREEIEPEILETKEVSMTVNLLSQTSSKTRFILIGSMAEYGQSGVLGEGLVCRPNTPYGIAKLKCTETAMYYAKHFDRRVTILRLFGVFGNAEPQHRLIPSIVSSANKNEPLLLSDGLQIRDFVHLGHVCRCITHILMTNSFNGQIVNIGSGEGISIKELILSLIDEGLLRRDLPNFGVIPRRKTDEDVLVADIARLQTVIKDKPLNVLDYLRHRLSTQGS